MIVEREVDPNLTLMDRIEDVIHRVDGIAVAAQGTKNWAAATGALRSGLRCCAGLLAKMGGLIQAGGRPINVAVGVHVDARGQQTSTLSEPELEQRIALEVSEATNGFDPATLDRLRQIAQNSTETDTLCRLPDSRL